MSGIRSWFTGHRTRRARTASGVDRKHRVVVLPLRVDSEPGSDREDPHTSTPRAEQLANGLTEELTRILTRTPNLHVIAHTSASPYRGSTKTVSEIAEELAAGVALVGRTRRSAARLEISVRLVDAAPRRERWTHTWEGVHGDVFAIQNEIARRVVSTLGASLPDEADELLHREPTSDVAAYDEYLVGRHHLSLRSEDGIRAAIRHFDRAIERDSVFALAWSSLADAYHLASFGYASIPRADALRRVREAAEEAVALDETLADAHASLGYLHDEAWAWPAAQEAFERALALAPSNPRARHGYAIACLHRGDLRLALEEYELALAVDPRSNQVLNESGWPYAYLSRFSEATERSRRVVHRDPENAMAYFSLGSYAERMGRPEEAVTYYRAAAELSARVPFITAFLGMALVTVGDRDEADAIARDLRRKASRGTPVATCLGALQIRLGRVDDGLGWLERGLEARESMALSLDTHLLPLPQVRGHPRFQALLERAPRPSLIGMRP
jgi:TolB-like protein/Flp pilus assembly protein TadD